MTYELWIYTRAGLTAAEVEDLVEGALLDLFASTPIGGHRVGSSRKLYQDDIKAAIGSVRDEVFHVVVTAPATDVVMAINEVPALGTVTATVHLVDPA